MPFRHQLFIGCVNVELPLLIALLTLTVLSVHVRASPGDHQARDRLALEVRDLERTCIEFRNLPENIEARSVACNANTTNGYYWRRTRKLGQYGFYSFNGSNVFPVCNADHLGDTAETWIWREETQLRDAATKYCRPAALCGNTICYSPCPGTNGPTFDCDSSPFCGLYEVECSRMSTSESGASGFQDSYYFLPVVIAGPVFVTALILVLIWRCRLKRAAMASGTSMASTPSAPVYLTHVSTKSDTSIQRSPRASADSNDGRSASTAASPDDAKSSDDKPNYLKKFGEGAAKEAGKQTAKQLWNALF